MRNSEQKNAALPPQKQILGFIDKLKARKSALFHAFPSSAL